MLTLINQTSNACCPSLSLSKVEGSRSSHGELTGSYPDQICRHVYTCAQRRTHPESRPHSKQMPESKFLLAAFDGTELDEGEAHAHEDRGDVDA